MLTLTPTLGHFGYPGGASRGQKVILPWNDFFLAEFFCFFCKTPYIYPRYQVWGVMDHGFDFAFYHPPLGGVPGMWLSGPPRLPFKPHPTIMIHPGQEKCMECVKRLRMLRKCHHKITNCQVWFNKHRFVFDDIWEGVRSRSSLSPERRQNSWSLYFTLMSYYQSVP